MGFAAAVVAVCMIVSGVFSFGGTYLANSLNRPEALVAPTASPGPSGNTVVFQAVVNTARTGSGEKPSVADVVATTKNSVVEITTERVSTYGRMGQFVTTGAGSGVIISSDGYIVTNNHVVEGAQSITVRLNDKSEFSATLVGTDAMSDLAIIRIDATNLQPAVFGDSESLLVGETTIAIGNPLGELGGTVTTGIISALDREITIDGESMSLLQTDASINPGNSGGGLFNLYGELVGIVNAKTSGSDIEGLGFAIPINKAKTVIEQLITFGYVTGRVDTGFVLVDVQDSRATMYYRVSKTGLYISTSANSAFQAGDLIVAVDGQPVTNLSDFSKLIDAYSVGDSIRISVERDGEGMTLSLTLQEWRP
ncbi:MAG: trypsin-like peptidase domain-containing protein [Eggerthellaceae bacterium]|nr:trypsin-like peptidase domain-containing protein [Eggerthellaceae bacterium]